MLIGGGVEKILTGQCHIYTDRCCQAEEWCRKEKWMDAIGDDKI